MAQSTTQPTDTSVATFLEGTEPPQKRADAETLAAMMARVSGEPAAMWGTAIVGFGRYHYRYDSGREGEMCRIGFSPRKAALTLYLSTGTTPRDDLLARLGRHSLGKGCLYVKRLADVDQQILEDLIAAAWTESLARYATS